VNRTRPFVIATRGSALALAQANTVLSAARTLFPKQVFELRTYRTTGDQMQTASLANPDASLPKGWFTKELEVALESGEADVAVHSLKDLPTELPDGLLLGGVLPRADVRDVLVYRCQAAVAASRSVDAEWSPGQRERRGYKPGLRVTTLPQGAEIATSSTRRAAWLQALRPDLKVVPIRGNVGTRLRKVAEEIPADATVLAAAGLVRLGLFLGPGNRLTLDPTLPPGHGCEPPPAGLLGTLLEPEEWLPAVGQGAIGLEIRGDQEDARELCSAMNHGNTFQAVTAERAFLRAVGGGCQSPMAAYARVVGHQLHLRAAVWRGGEWRRGEGRRVVREAGLLGEELGRQLG
jgi:hydroxymethylbilane synthase